MWRKEEKLQFLSQVGRVSNVQWQEHQPDERSTWLNAGMQSEFADFFPMGTREAKAMHSLDMGDANIDAIFKIYSLGVNTARDQVAYNFDQNRLQDRVEEFIEAYNDEVSRWERAGQPKDIDKFVRYDNVKWSEGLKLQLNRKIYAKFEKSKIRRSIYRPFCNQWLFFDRSINERVYQMPQVFPTSNPENVVIAVGGYGRKAFSALALNCTPNLNFYADPAQCFPLYTYAEDGSARRDNISEWALAQFRAAYGDDVTKRDIFAYVYALLHHPTYRERYAENLKRELPRIPLIPGRAAWETLTRIGNALLTLHLTYEQAKEYRLQAVETPGEPINWRVKKMRLSADKTTLTVNEWLTLAGIPEAAQRYRLGNRSALEWVVDQYQVTTDARSGITSDPNRDDDDPQYIVRLVRQVVTVSVETVRLVDELAREVDVLAAVPEAVVVSAASADDNEQSADGGEAGG